MNRHRGKPIFYTLLASILIISLFLYIKHTNPSTDTETIMVCLAIFTAVAFFLEYHQNSLLNEAQFVIDLNNQFLNEGKLASVEHDLEMYYNTARTEKSTIGISKYLEEKYAIEKDERQNLVNYLVHLEGIATLVNNGMLRLSSINDLMAYRFFIAVNNPIVQELEICQYQEYYQGIINLNKAWVPVLQRKKSTIPMSALCLEKKLNEEQDQMPEMNEKKTATKSRILFLLRYFLENTDDEHALNTNDLIVALEKNGFSANRKTVRDDVDMLCDAGYEILIDKDGKSNSYHFGARTFELPELKMLIDAVSSSRFISAEKSEALIQKLTSLTSRYEAKGLTAKIFTADRIKADNGKIFLTTDVVSRAIEQEKKVSFQYYDYLPTKEKVLKNDGEVYIISPYALIWSDDRYYLVGFSDKRHELTPFRVDRMTVPQITEEPAVKNTSFNPADFTNKVVQMYPSGIEETVTLRCKNENMRSVIDKFGEDITVDVIDTEHFTAKVQVQPSQTFYGWVFTFCGDIEIIEPKEVREEFLSIARKVLGE